MAYKRRVTESGHIRITHTDDTRVTESSTPDLGSLLGASITILPRSDLGARVGILTNEDLGGQISVLPKSDLGSTITILQDASSDLGAEVSIPTSNYEDLGGTVKIVTYHYNGLLSTIFVKGTSDLGSQIDVLPYKELGGSITIETVLGGRLTIPARSELEASVNVTVDHQLLGAETTVIQDGENDLGGTIVVGQFLEDLPATINVTLGDQAVGGKVTVLQDGSSDLDASVNVTVEHQSFDASVNVIASGYIDTLSSSVNVVSTLQHLNAELIVNVIGDDDIGALIDITANVPSIVSPTGYIVPSGYPPLPSGWVDPSGYATPGIDAVVVPEGVWQQEDEFLFLWNPPSDWGMGASYGGYTIAWNDDPDHVVSDSDQYVANNYIQKNWYDSGDRWFHIRAKNSYGYFGVQGSYNIKINTLPSEPVDPFYIDDISNTSGYTNSSKPFFYWGKSTDSDQLDTLSYELQVYPSGVLPGGIDTVHIEEIAQTGAGDTQEYQIEQHIGVGLYRWRVRAFDSKQFGDWADDQPLIIDPDTSDLNSRLVIPTIDIANLGASVNIVGYNDLSSSVNVFVDTAADLSATVNVGYRLDSELGATIRILSTEDLSARINIVEYRDLLATVNVYNVYGYEDIGATVKVGRRSDSEIGGSITIAEYSENDLGAFVNIPRNIDLGAIVTVYDEDNFGFIDDFSRDFPSTIHITAKSDDDIGGLINTIADRPGEVIITANVPEATWQEENNIEFEWTETFANFLAIEGYYTTLDRDSDTEADDSFQNTSGLFRAFNLELLEGAGVYYFHVAAKATNGLFGPTSHFAVWYNHRVPDPGLPMLVNNNDSIIQFVMVAASLDINLEWGQSIDLDALDVIVYKLQIATQEDFGVNELMESSIIYEVEDIPTYFHVVSSGAIDSGTYYWRVMSNDGHQDSAGWSPVGRFYLNTPPSKPTDLIVYN